MNRFRRAKLKDGKQVYVYEHKLRQGKWINYSDCTTEYNEKDLEFQN